MDRGNHVYEEIDSAHQHTPQHAHQPSRTSDRDSGMGRSEFSASSQLLSRGTPVEGSSPTKGDSPSHKTQPKLEPLKKSTDRPLASSFERNQESRMSVRTESEMVRSSRKARVRKPSLDTIMQEKPEDQIMDVTLHRSVGTRLGITLGFDQNKKTSKLYVMHVSVVASQLVRWFTTYLSVVLSSYQMELLPKMAVSWKEMLLSK
jgi:hypothetical protein